LTSPDPNAFSEALGKVFAELHRRWLELAPEHMVITDERLLTELAIPAQRPTRICYFSLPGELISFYRDSVFPLADQAGLVPATGDETLGAAGSAQAMIGILLERAWAVVADVSTGDRRVRRELRAARRMRPTRVQEITQLPSTKQAPSSTETIDRPPLLGSRPPNVVVPPGPSNWLVQLRSWLDSQGASATEAVHGAARNLAHEGNHRHALIAAVSALESRLQSVLKQAPDTGAAPVVPPTSGSHLTMLLERARERGILSAPDVVQLQAAQDARTALAHRPDTISDLQAKPLADFTLALLDRLKVTR
jgi:hypothetical protein